MACCTAPCPSPPPHDIEALIKPDTTVVAIDEAQFFDSGMIDLCKRLAGRGVRVIVAGLDTDFRGEPFGPMPLIMAEAEMVDKLQAICVVCGAPASRTQRMIDGQPASYDDPIIMVGAKENYEARCRHCHEVPGAPGTQTVESEAQNQAHEDEDEGTQSGLAAIRQPAHARKRARPTPTYACLTDA